MENVLIIDAKRSPIGKLLGKISNLTATKICSYVIDNILVNLSGNPFKIDEVIMGNVITSGVGQNPARQVALLSDLDKSVSAFTVNKVCASGLKAVALGVQALRLGDREVVIAGGMESMSNAPFLLKDLRKGKRFGGTELIDAMISDGLWDLFYDAHMGTLCEFTVERYKISREEQDAFALKSHKKAIIATKTGNFKDEIVDFKLKHKTDNIDINVDESIRWDTDSKQLAGLKPVFGKNGTITAGNAPGLNDGAAALLLMTEKKAKELKVEPLAEIIAYHSTHLDPKWYPIAPVAAVKGLLKKTGLKITDFDLVELNEAFAAQAIAVIRDLNFDPSKVNINGGAISLGHPIGASGARILVTLIHALKKNKKELGLATLCLGGGGAMSMAVRAFK